MPVHVSIRINDQLITEVHIGRVTPLHSNTQVSTYMAVSGVYPDRNVPYTRKGVAFEHKYDEGVQVCVQKALVALGFD